MNLSGTRIGMLQIIDIDVERPWSKKSYTCLCDCGRVCTRLESSLNRAKKAGTNCSCGCTYIQYLTPGDSERCSKAGSHRKDAFQDGCNIQMTFRGGTISTNQSGHQGISWSESAHKWHVYIGYKNYRANLGYVEDIEDGVKLRKLAEDAIKQGTFEDFYFNLRGFHLEDRNTPQFKKKSL